MDVRGIVFMLVVRAFGWSLFLVAVLYFFALHWYAPEGAEFLFAGKPTGIRR